MKRCITRTKADRFCTLEITVEDGRLSICGDEGRILAPKAAKTEAIRYWQSFFEENRNELHAMNDKQGTNFKSARSAAKYVLETDGEYHGLDAKERDGKILVTESCGQIRETLLAFFPEVAPLLPWHLNDMHAGCEHQDALGWGHGKTIALASDALTATQRLTVEGNASRVCEHKRAKREKELIETYAADHNKGVAFLKRHNGGRAVSIDESNALPYIGGNFYIGASSYLKRWKLWVKEEVEAEIKPIPFDAAIYKDSIGAPCPECGYEYGTKWLKRDLPAEIIELAATVCKNTSPAPVSVNETTE